MEKLCGVGRKWEEGAVNTYRLNSWGLCGCGGKCRLPSKPYFAGDIQPSTPCFHGKRQTPAEALHETIKRSHEPSPEGVWDRERGWNAERLTPI